jgi:hypothetical protein
MTTSRYVVTTDLAAMQRAGCNQGQSGESGIVVLDFGYPIYNTSTGQYGTILPDAAGTYISFGDIGWILTGFVGGYYYCATTPGQHIVLALGTNNSPKHGGVVTAHGQRWGQLVDDMVRYINMDPPATDKISIAAAVNIELQLNTFTPTRDWLNAYQPTNRNPIYNFGNCNSCPWFGGPTWTPSNGWTPENIYYVSYGADLAWPLPLIYRTDGQHADQWYRISRYTYTNPERPMYFAGAMTQWYACVDSPVEDCHALQTDNTPSQGWTQLWQALNADPVTAQNLDWSTDIRWDKEKVK